jgi:hypothetical protein
LNKHFTTVCHSNNGDERFGEKIMDRPGEKNKTIRGIIQSFQNLPPTTRNILLFTFISLVILIGSYVSIFEFKSMYLDDMGRYDLAIHNLMHQHILERNFFRAYVMQVAYELMEYDLMFSRLYIFAFMTFSSIFFFVLLNRYLKISPAFATFAAILPYILPGQTKIPAFVDGSYTVPGLAIYFIALLFGLEFIHKEERKSYIYLILSSVVFAVALRMMDHTIFLIVPTIYLFFALGFADQKRIKRSLILGVIFITQTGIGLWEHFNGEMATADYLTPLGLSLADIISRITRSIFFMFPISTDNYIWHQIMTLITGFILVIVLILFILSLIDSSTPFMKKIGLARDISVGEYVPIIFGVIWFICSSFVFWFASPYYSDRYFFIPVHGLIVIFTAFLYSGYIRYHYFFSTKKRLWLVAFFIAYITIILSVRADKLHARYDPTNRAHELLKNAIETQNFPKHAQIVLAGNPGLSSGGYWRYSTGYLRYLLKRNDVSGVISYTEMQFYDPFDPTEQHFYVKMSGMDLTKPLFLYRYRSGKITTIKYALQWKAAEWTKGIPGNNKLGAATISDLQNSEWTIYHFDLVSGDNKVIASGVGLKEYRIFIEKSNIEENLILWAGPMNNTTRKRFGLDLVKEPVRKSVNDILIRQAEKGNVKSQIRLAILYGGSEGVKKNLSKKAYWLERAANNNDPYAQYQLGIMYSSGEGVEKNVEKSIDLFKKSANQGDRWGEYFLGIAFLTGTGVTKDYKIASDWFEKSASKGVPHAKFHLGIMYENGMGFKKDNRLAEKWYMNALNDDYEPARTALNKIRK